MASGPITLTRVMAGSVRRIRFTIKKDGSPWDLTAATVTLRFEKPDRETTFDRTMTKESAVGGIVYYDTTTDEIDESGRWTLGVKVVDSIITIWYPYEISLPVSGEQTR